MDEVNKLQSLIGATVIYFFIPMESDRVGVLSAVDVDRVQLDGAWHVLSPHPQATVMNLRASKGATVPHPLAT